MVDPSSTISEVYSPFLSYKHKIIATSLLMSQ